MIKITTDFMNNKIPLIVSIIAIFVSLGSLYYSSKAYSLSHTQYEEERLILLQGFFPKDGSLQIKSIDPSITLLKGELFFPSSVTGEAFGIEPDGLVKGYGNILLKLKEFVLKKNISQKDYIVVYEFNVPIIIRSEYTAKGKRYIDTSVYSLEISSTVGTDRFGPTIEYKGLLFFARYLERSNILPSKALEAIYKEGQKSDR